MLYSEDREAVFFNHYCKTKPALKKCFINTLDTLHLSLERVFYRALSDKKNHLKESHKTDSLRLLI